MARKKEENTFAWNEAIQKMNEEGLFNKVQTEEKVKSKIIVTVRDGVVENVFSNLREDIEIEVEVSYLTQLTSYENLDQEIARKQKGFRDIY